MRRKLIYNYWLIIISWCMFLNDNILLAVIACLGAIALLLSNRKKINYWRMCFLSILSYTTISFILSRSSIPYFFPKLYYFLAFICLDMALTNEHLYLFKSKYLRPFVIMLIISLVVLSIMVIVLPNDLYTLFTKKNLFMMVNLIFLPYLASIVVCIIYKANKKRSKVLSRQLSVN